jgi:hypothetical protein
MYLWESQGKGNLRFGVMGIDKTKPNGYAVGKRWMQITVNMWREDIKKGLLFVWELYEEKRYPNWWLDEVLRT